MATVCDYARWLAYVKISAEIWPLNPSTESKARSTTCPIAPQDEWQKKSSKEIYAPIFRNRSKTLTNKAAAATARPITNPNQMPCAPKPIRKAQAYETGSATTQ